MNVMRQRAKELIPWHSYFGCFQDYLFRGYFSFKFRQQRA